MYTGVVQNVGEICTVEMLSSGCRVRVAVDTTDITSGDSIGISGVCLTVESVDDDHFEAILSSETVERTYLSDLTAGDSINIEKPVTPDGRLDGHVVKGTVDATTEIAAIADVGSDWRFSFTAPNGYQQYLVEKGAVAVDGISLTITELTREAFSVAVVPATYHATTLSDKSVGDPVHFEADILAKYVEQQRRVENEASA